MMDINPSDLKIQLAYALSPSHIFLSCSIAPVNSELEDTTAIFRQKDGVWMCWILEYLVVGIESVEKDGENHVVLMGNDGQFAMVDNNNLQQGIVHQGGGSPNKGRSLTRLKKIGSSLYVCGMARMVFSADSHEQLTWQRLDKGCLIDSKSTEINGFLDIAGLSEDDICAVGFKGDIWIYHSCEWAKVESPTNVKLAMVGKFGNQFIVGGNHGTILSGHGELWESIEQDVIQDCLRYGVEFNDCFYATTETGKLFQFNDELEVNSVQVGVENVERLYHVFTCGEFLYVASPSDIYYTKDIKNWASFSLPG